MYNSIEKYFCVCNSFFTLWWLKEVFLPYLDDWEKGVNEKDGCTQSEKAMMLLSEETRMGVRITGE